jgi:hypothetical protein
LRRSLTFRGIFVAHAATIVTLKALVGDTQKSRIGEILNYFRSWCGGTLRALRRVGCHDRNFFTLATYPVYSKYDGGANYTAKGID